MTGIEWTQKTWNPIAGCSLVSPGCTYCYAMRDAKRVMLSGKSPHYEGVVEEAANGRWVWTGRIGIAPDAKFEEPLRRKKPTIYFVNSMSDLFHPDVPDEAIDRVMEIMGAREQHIFQVLTKRAPRMHDYLKSERAYRAWNARRLDREAWPARNVWWGVSCEDQRRADERIPELLASPARIRFVSCEPLLGPIQFSGVLQGDWLRATYREKAGEPSRQIGTTLDWVIVGGESGDRARPMHPEWAREIRDQCIEAKVPFFFKQWGSWAPVDAPASETQEDMEIRGVGTMIDGQYFHRLPSKHWDGYDRLDECQYKEFPMSAIVGELV